MRLEIGRSWETKLKGRIERYNFEVGILDDAPHRDAKEPSEFGTYAGDTVRKAGRKSTSGLNVSDVLVQNMQRLNINILLRPFQDKNADILKFTKAFLQFAVSSKKVSIRRVENLLQAIVRNPILREEYGKNKARTADAKGFSRHLIDTGQMFKKIISKAKKVR